MISLSSVSIIEPDFNTFFSSVITQSSSKISAKRTQAVSGKIGLACGRVLHVGFIYAILCDMYAALGRLYEIPPVGFSYPAKFKK